VWKALRWKQFFYPAQVWKGSGEKWLFYYYPHKCGKLQVKNTSFLLFFNPKTCVKSSRWKTFSSQNLCEKLQVGKGKRAFLIPITVWKVMNPQKSSFVREQCGAFHCVSRIAISSSSSSARVCPVSERARAYDFVKTVALSTDFRIAELEFRNDLACSKRGANFVVSQFNTRWAISFLTVCKLPFCTPGSFPPSPRVFLLLRRLLLSLHSYSQCQWPKIAAWYNRWAAKSWEL